jgi:hypothetical protein
MKQYPFRETVDLSGYPDPVVIYLGMRVNALRGLATLLGMGPRIASAARARPDGLLAHENIIYSLFPAHVGMRQYWRDFDSLERWSRSETHRIWWQNFIRNPKGTGFWHEAYFRRGGMEAIYTNVPDQLGFRAFAPICPAQGPMFSSRQRAGRDGQAPPVPVQE